MPQALPFSAEPDMKLSQGTSRQRMNRVMTAQFGDGYSQELPDGINANFDVWNVEYAPLSLTDRNTLWTALNAVGASDYLTWQPPGASASQKFKVVKDSVNEEPWGDLWNISLQLRQVF